jgi:hypothetical protein
VRERALANSRLIGLIELALMIARAKNFGKKVAFAIAIGLVLFMVLAVVSNVPTEITRDDQEAFASINIPLPIKPPTQSLTFEGQIKLIRALQAEVFERAPLLPDDPGIPLYEAREPKNLFKYRHGLCFDRSRTLDKLLNYYGFETRHTYVLYKENRSFIGALFTYGHPSHAVTEVKTSKGWMLVDSNDPWVAVTNANNPINTYLAQFHVDELAGIPDYFKKPYWVIVGLYSKRGQLYKPFVPFPQLNWPTFFYWVNNGL